MAQQTALSVTATPGGLHTFSPKGGGGKGSGQITDLSVHATPGALHSFSPKAAAGGAAADQITDLTVWATPGGLRAFTAKTAAEIIAAEAFSGPGYGRRRKDEEEIIAILMAYRTLH